MENNIGNVTKSIAEILEEINTLADQLKLKEAIFVKHYIKEEDYDRVRAYMESCVIGSERRILSSLEHGKYNPEFAERYRIVKKIDNLITYLCEKDKN